MKPRIVFLGTGQGPTVVGKQIRASAGIVIQSGGHQIYIDPGPGSLSMAREYYVNPRETTCLLVSHPHVNHCNDVNVLIDAMTVGGLDKMGVLIANNLLVNGDSLIRPYLTDFHKSCLEKYIVLKPEQKVAVDEIEIHTTTTVHTVDNMGFKVIAPEFVVSYLSDTGFHPLIVKEHQGSDILILNVVNPGDVKTKYNLNSEMATKIISKIKPRLAVITHFSLKMLQADPLLEARNINRQTKTQVVAAKDGFVINPLTFAAKRRQTSLENFKK